MRWLGGYGVIRMWAQVKRWAPWGVKGALSVAIIAYVFHKVDLATAWQQAKHADLVWVAAALLAQLVQIPIGGIRWHSVARAIARGPGPHLGLLRANELFYISSFINVVIPGAVGGDGFRMWRVRRDGVALGEAVSSVMLERVASLFGLFCLVTATEPALIGRIGTLPGAWVFPGLTALGAFGIVVLMVLDRLPDSLTHIRLVRGLVGLAGAARAVFLRPVTALIVMVWSILGHANLAVVVWFLAKALHLDVDLFDCMALVPPVILLLTLPISISGWGVREQAMVTAFALVGVQTESALVLSLMFGVIGILASLPGGLLWLAARDPGAMPDAALIDEAAP